MDRTDADMMEAESSVPSPAPPDVLGFNPIHNDVIEGLLALARQLIDRGKPSQALQAVVMAMRAKGGDEAVFQALNRAKEVYRNKAQASAAADELASLFAECAIAEALPSRPEQSHIVVHPTGPELDVNGTSILAESGRKQIMLDAFSDGSSFVCLQCGGLVSNHRKEEHYAFWCC